MGREDVVGIFTDRGQAERAVTALVDAGFPESEIGFLAPGENTEPEYFGPVAKAMAAGSAGGAAAGALLGALATVALPGIGAAVAGGTLLAAAMGGVTGGATGGVAGLLFGAASSHAHALYYSQEVGRGRTLVTVTCPPDSRAEARRIMQGLGALEAAPMAPEDT